MHHLFISYSRKDRPFVERLSKEMAAIGHDPWVDWKDIPPTAAFMEEIRRAIESADTFVFVLSPDSTMSAVCAQEIDHAAKNHKRMVPVVCREVRAEQVHAALAALNWIFFDGAADFEASIALLKVAIETDLAWVQAHTDLLVRATEWEKAGRNRSPLLRGADLTAAEQRLVQAADGKQPQPTKLQQEYVNASRRDTSRRLRVVIGAVSAALVMTAVLAVVALMQSRLAERRRVEEEAQRRLADTRRVEAEQQRSLADRRRIEAEEQRQLAEERARIATSQRLAADSKNQLKSSLDLALLLGVEAYRTNGTVEAREALLAALQQSPTVRWFLHGHKTELYAVAFSPDGRTMASTGPGETLFWDVAKPQAIGTACPGFYARAFDFSPDGRFLAVGTWDHRTLFIDTKSRKPLGPELKADFESFGSDGMAITVDSRGEMRKYDPAAQRASAVLFQVPDVIVANRAFSRDGKLAAIGEPRYGITFWDLASRTALDRPPGIPNPNITALKFDPRGTYLACAEYGGDITIWDTKARKPTGKPLKFHNGPVHALAISSDGNIIASGGTDGQIRLWDAGLGRAIGEPLTGHKREVKHLAFSADKKTLVSAGADGQVMVWDVLGPMSADQSLTGHNIVASVDAFGESATISKDAQDDVLGGTLELLKKGTMVMNFSANGKFLAIGRPGGALQFWDVAARKSLGEARLNFGDTIESLALTPDGRLAAASGPDQPASEDNHDDRARVEIIDVATRRRLMPPLRGQQYFGQQLAFSPDSRMLIVSDLDRFWYFDGVARKRLGPPVRSGLGETFSLAFRPDGRTLVASAMLMKLNRAVTVLWDVEARKTIGAPLGGHDSPVDAIAFSPDGKILAEGDQKGNVLVRDAATLQPVALPFLADVNGVRVLAFSHDGRLLATGGGTGLQLWDVQSRQPVGRPLVSPTVLGSGSASELVAAAAFTPDGQTLLAAYPLSQTVVRWDLRTEAWIDRACRIANRNLSTTEWAQFNGDGVAYRRTCPSTDAKLINQPGVRR